MLLLMERRVGLPPRDSTMGEYGALFEETSTGVDQRAHVQRRFGGLYRSTRPARLVTQAAFMHVFTLSSTQVLPCAPRHRAPTHTLHARAHVCSESGALRVCAFVYA